MMDLFATPFLAHPVVSCGLFTTLLLRFVSVFSVFHVVLFISFFQYILGSFLHRNYQLLKNNLNKKLNKSDTSQQLK